MNEISIVGNLVRDDEVKGLNDDGTRGFHNFAVAVNKAKKINGQWVQEPSFFDCVFYAKCSMSQRLTKGTMISASGSMIQQRWPDKETGQKRSKWVMECKTVECHKNKTNYNSAHPQSEDVKDPSKAEEHYTPPPVEDYVAPPTYDGPDIPDAPY